MVIVTDPPHALRSRTMVDRVLASTQRELVDYLDRPVHHIQDAGR